VPQLEARRSAAACWSLALAIFHFRTNSISRGAGRSATAAAAYRAGERIRDERTGVLHNYSRRTDVSHTEIMLPSRLNAAEVAWATQRTGLWNAAERMERRGDARVAREYQVALPAELDGAQRLQLVRTYARELAERHNVAIDLAVHAPRAGGDPRNYHAHLLATSREITSTGFGAKAGLDMQGEDRRRLGLPVGIAEIRAMRARWAVLSNEALAAAGLSVRVDHRSLRLQGIDREPTPHIPFAAIQMERRGLRSEIAERIRARYRERVLARQARSQGLDPDVVRRQAREAWLKMREQVASPGESTPSRGHIKESLHTQQRTPDRSQASNVLADEQRRAADEHERDAADRDFAL
jgi:ATP-dependent exoDNAse (exonuclease V) alpha subunit